MIIRRKIDSDYEYKLLLHIILRDEMSFKDIEFGMAEAENERVEKPYLLLEAFMDENKYIDNIINGNKFIVLGPKGSGKSAIASRIELLSETKNDYYVHINYLSNFPYKAFSNILLKKESPETTYPDTWTLLIILSLLNSFYKDKDIKSRNPDEFENIKSILLNLNLIFNDNKLIEIVKKTSERNFKVEIPKVLSYHQTKTSETKPSNIFDLFEFIKNCFYNIKGKKDHILVIDGLDDILTKTSIQYDSLAALILATDRLNKEIKKREIPAKIIILSRTDLFERLPGPNKNKIRQDRAIELNWFHTVREPENSDLIKLANLRAETSLGRSVDIFSDFIPLKLYRDELTIKVILNYTRHLPRDLIQVLNNIQKHCKSSRVTKDNILEGLRTYSTNYFIPEIKDELVGYISDNEVNLMFDLFASMRKNEFTYDDLVKKSKDYGKYNELNIEKTLKSLFDCSAIGNIVKVGGKTHFYYKYRNRQSNLDLNEKIHLHRAISKGLSLN